MALPHEHMSLPGLTGLTPGTATRSQIPRRLLTVPARRPVLFISPVLFALPGRCCFPCTSILPSHGACVTTPS